MSATISQAALLSLAVDRSAKKPAYAQLYQQFRALILAGSFAANERLPSTRMLAQDLGLSRTCVNGAYDQLASEGYIFSRRGAGTFVTKIPPDHLLLAQRSAGASTPGPPPVSRKPEEKPLAAPFQPYAVAFEQFPHKTWARLLGQSWRHPSSDLLWRADPLGHLPLRHAIAEHLRAWRGIDCRPEQIAITCGIGDALDIVLRAIARPKQQVWVEDPGFAEMRNAVLANGYQPAPQDVDDNGLDVEKAVSQCSGACAAIVTPSRQFPLGATLSLSRRLALLDWARKQKTWIIEDDFDSEYRFSGQPLSPLMTLDEGSSVIYLGSFSKVMLRSLRLGYIVFPASFRSSVTSVLERHGAKASLIAQPALAQFIASGEFAAYIRKTRRLYAARLGIMLEALGEEFGDDLIVGNQTGGLHLIAELSPQTARHSSDVAISKKARQAGLILPALSSYYQKTPRRQGFLLGFAGFNEDAIRSGLSRLARIIYS